MQQLLPRKIALTLITLATVGQAAETRPASTVVPPAERLFAGQIYPLLRDKCLPCHGDDPDDLRGGLDLRTLSSALAGGDSGEPSLVPGKPEESLLFLAATRVSDIVSAMPPKENDRLTEKQIASLNEWITTGAQWPGEARLAELLKTADQWSVAEGVQVPTSGGLSADWTNRRYDPANLWAYQPLPEVSDFTADSVDGFIGQELSQRELAPAPPADRRTLIRRATFDLIGLPPQPHEIEAFLADPRPDDIAFAAVIERLLASTHYGEQWGRHWLDVVRYADSAGFANDYVRGNAWRYRDYVVRAFNNDKPYDQFILEQIAGDEILELGRAAELTPETPDSELLIAPGFLRMGPWELTGMEVPRIARQRFLDDVTDLVGQAFLGHMLQCARCHDHKFDPVPTRDYYSIQAAFATTQLAERAAPFLKVENCTGFEERRFYEERKQHYVEMQSELNSRTIAAAREWYQEQGIDPADFERLLSEVKNGDYDTIRNRLRRKGVPEDQLPPRRVGFRPQDFGNERVSRKGIERLNWQFDMYEPFACSVYSGRTPELRSVNAPLRVPKHRMKQGDLEQSFILTGGDPFSPGQSVTPGVLSAVAGIIGQPVLSSATSAVSFSNDSDEKLNADSSAPIVGRRLALARWIAAERNPLTARVMVNRIWQGHFGKGLAENPNNFGATGKKPSHPELLDWLAVEFMQNEWSVKAMHRIVMNSKAYRRSSTHPTPEQLAHKDPHRDSFAAFLPRRLTSEELHDALLAVSGELNPELGGIPARPEIHPEVALQPRQVMGTFAEAWQPNPLPKQRHRRSIYALHLRGLRDPFQEVFNAPSPEISCEARESSTVTPQVFALFNGRATYQRALALADRITRETDSSSAAISRACSLCFGRPATNEEIQRCLDHWRAMTKRHESLTFESPSIPSEVVREAVEENTGEKFTFEEPLEVADEFIPDLQPEDVTPRIRGLAEVCLVLLNANEFIYVY